MRALGLRNNRSSPKQCVEQFPVSVLEGEREVVFFQWVGYNTQTLPQTPEMWTVPDFCRANFSSCLGKRKKISDRKSINVQGWNIQLGSVNKQRYNFYIICVYVQTIFIAIIRTIIIVELLGHLTHSVLSLIHIQMCIRDRRYNV